ncbi:MAG TPA: S8 family serine peptidase [Verrucomicrobiales bacterium]|nr:S8 family serine peptidase [Verrucomicrobiales bacterium]
MFLPLQRAVASGLFLIPVAAVQAAPSLATRYTVRDAGRVRTFETAADELSVHRPDGSVMTEKSRAATIDGLKTAMAARRAAAQEKERVDVVLYEAGRPRGNATRRWATPGVLAILAGGTDAGKVAALAGATSWKPAPVLAGAVILTFDGGAGAALAGAQQLRAMTGVISAEPLLARQFVKRWTPNDPYFSYNISNPGYEWHLRNTGENGGTAGIDINVTGVWETWRGNGIRIGIVDDGMQTSHPDLGPASDTVNDYDWNGMDNDPSPATTNDHGTGCAGLAAGKGNNGTGICGAAPEATLVGLRLIGGPATDETQAAAFLHRNDIIQVKSNSWGPSDDPENIEGPDALTAAALAESVRSGRGGLGTILVWAAGNGLEVRDDSNFDGYANSIYVIATSAVTDRGVQAHYSEPGANILIAAPGSGRNGEQDITTTDLIGQAGYNDGGGTDYPNGDYTKEFGGTSASCPLVAGAVALVLQSKPSLGWRDVQEVLIRTATKVDTADTGWFNNAAGFHFNDKYGAGLINTAAAVTLAATWTNLEPMASRTRTSSGAVPIPDASSAGAVKTFTLTAANFLRVEHAAVKVDIQHPSRGQLELELVSPSGTLSRLARSRPDDNEADLTWTFTTSQFWGESSTGTWTLRVKDATGGSTGALNDATLTLYGTGIPGAPAITSSDTVSGLAGVPFSYQATASPAPVSWSAASLPAGLTIDSDTGLISGTPAAAGVFFTELAATNAAGTGGTTLTITVTVPPEGIGEALDAPDLTFTTLGTPWFLQSAASHDGVDAARSGAIPHDASSGLQTMVTGPLTVTFWWQVSSQTNFDRLRFLMDNVEVKVISGNVPWSQMAIYVPAGAHALRWSYEKNGSSTAGMDAGWVDEIRFHSFILPMKADGVGTGFQEPSLNAAFHLHNGGGEMGWIASAGKVAESGNRNPPLTGTTTAGTTGVKSFEINNALAVLRTDTVDLAGFFNVRGGADVRTYTTATTNFEAPDSLRIYLELSTDLAAWVEGPDILPLRTGGTNPVPDALILLNTDGNATYHHFATPPDSIPAGMRYARMVVNGVTDGGSERLVIDNLRFTGTPSNADADGDGIPAEVEAWFGTSDENRGAVPFTSLAVSEDGPSLSFPSLRGYAYAVEFSDDLLTWNTVPVTAFSGLTSWSDATAPLLGRRYYRVRRP